MQGLIGSKLRERCAWGIPWSRDSAKALVDQCPVLAMK
jgi:hypothetical protein